jgi:hypothetical protein
LDLICTLAVKAFYWAKFTELAIAFTVKGSDNEHIEPVSFDIRDSIADFVLQVDVPNPKGSFETHPQPHMYRSDNFRNLLCSMAHSLLSSVFNLEVVI